MLYEFFVQFLRLTLTFDKPTLSVMLLLSAHPSRVGTFYTIKFATPHLKRNGGGSIVVCASINGTRQFSNTGATAYATSKAGQVALARMVRNSPYTQ